MNNHTCPDVLEVFCAWCKRSKAADGLPYGPVFAKDDYRYQAGSHGICLLCLQHQMQVIRKDRFYCSDPNLPNTFRLLQLMGRRNRGEGQYQ